MDKMPKLWVQLPGNEVARNREADTNTESVVSGRRTVKPNKLMAFAVLTSFFGVAVGAALPRMDNNDSVATTEHDSQKPPKAKMSGGDQFDYILMLVFSTALMVLITVTLIFRVQRRLKSSEMTESEAERYDEIKRNKEDKSREDLAESLIDDVRNPLRKYPQWAQEMDNNFARRIVNQATGHATDHYGEKDIGDEVQCILKRYRGRRGESLGSEFNERTAISDEEKQRLVRKIVFWRVLRQAFTPWVREQAVSSTEDVVASVLVLMAFKTAVLGLAGRG